MITIPVRELGFDYDTVEELFAEGGFTLAVVVRGKDIFCEPIPIPKSGGRGSVFFRGHIPLDADYSLRFDGVEVARQDVYSCVREPERSQVIQLERSGVHTQWTPLECVVTVD